MFPQILPFMGANPALFGFLPGYGGEVSVTGPRGTIQFQHAVPGGGPPGPAGGPGVGPGWALQAQGGGLPGRPGPGGGRAHPMHVQQAIATLQAFVAPRTPGAMARKRGIMRQIHAWRGAGDAVSAELVGLDQCGALDPLLGVTAADYGAELGYGADPTYGAVAPGYGADAPTTGFADFLAYAARANAMGQALQTLPYQQVGPTGPGAAYGVVTQGAPATTGNFERIPMFLTQTGVNPVIEFATGAVDDAPTAAVTLVTRPKPYKAYRIVGLAIHTADRSAGCQLLIQNLNVQGAGVNLLSEDAGAWNNADDYAADNPANPGLRTAEGSVVQVNNIAQMTMAITGDPGDTAKISATLITTGLDDVVGGRGVRSAR